MQPQQTPSRKAAAASAPESEASRVEALFQWSSTQNEQLLLALSKEGTASLNSSSSFHTELVSVKTQLSTSATNVKEQLASLQATLKAGEERHTDLARALGVIGKDVESIKTSHSADNNIQTVVGTLSEQVAAIQAKVDERLDVTLLSPQPTAHAGSAIHSVERVQSDNSSK
jgi:small-conductance mechanosensitive channel